ncbi:MAG: serine protease [Patescibacteria group bacterium]
MESLTKQQIVLLTLLVSFITSIATGIITVALMDQAPPGVTQTINRVVEHTIEKVTQGSNQSAAVVTKETVVVKEDDLVVAAIEKNVKSLVSIIGIVGTPENYREVFLGNGLILDKTGLIATDAAVIKNVLDVNFNPIPESFKATFPDGTTLALSLNPSNAPDATIVFLKAILDDKTKNSVFTPAAIADSSSVKLGQSIVILGGEKIAVATGIVSNISYDGAVGTTTPSKQESKISTIKTDASVPNKALGGILVNLSGDVVGIHVTAAGTLDNVFLPSAVISSAKVSSKI